MTHSSDPVQDILRLIREKSTFAVVSHISPDGDTTGSQLAMKRLLEHHGKRVTVINQDPMPRVFEFLKEPWVVADPKSAPLDVDAAFFMECPTPDRAGVVFTMLDARRTVLVNVDHHISNSRYGQINWVLPDYAACGELVYDLFEATATPLDAKSAVYLYISLVADTGHFSYSNTTARTHQIAGRLLAAGVKPAEIHQQVYESQPVGMLKLLGHALQTLQTSPDGRISWVTITEDMLKRCGAGYEDGDGFVNYPRSLAGVEVALCFRQRGAKIKVSLRSQGRVDVNQVALGFGGGGHARASGCELPGPMEQAVAHVVKAASGALPR